MDYAAVEDLVKSTRDIIFAKRELKVSMKGASDFVTDVDLAISGYLKAELAALDASVGFFSEEEDGFLHDDCWVLDPIDGTTNLVYDYQLSSVSLARYTDGKIVYGIVYNPFTDETFTAVLGKGAWYNGTRRLQVSDRSIGQALVEFGAGSTHKENTEENFKLAMEIFKQCVDVRRICSSALDLCYIAAGRIDGYFERVLKPWDVAAGSLILQEAGGVITDYAGAPLQFAEKTSVVAGNVPVQACLLETIQRFEREKNHG